MDQRQAVMTLKQSPLYRGGTGKGSLRVIHPRIPKKTVPEKQGPGALGEYTWMGSQEPREKKLGDRKSRMVAMLMVVLERGEKSGGDKVGDNDVRNMAEVMVVWREKLGDRHGVR